MIEKTSDVYLLPQRPLLRANGPLYRQLADVLRDPIASGSYPVGSELPKEADIANRFSVSLMTVRQALRELEAEKGSGDHLFSSGHRRATQAQGFHRCADLSFRSAAFESAS